MIASIAIVGIAVHLVARQWHPRRLFLFDMDRELTGSDRARIHRVMGVNLAVTLGCIAAVLFTDDEPVLVLASAVGPFVPITWMLAEFVLAVRTRRRKMTSVPFRVPPGDAPPLVSYLSAPLQVGNAAVVVLPTGLFVWLLSILPADIPVHYGISGQPDRWSSPHELWFFLGILVFDWVILWFVAWAVAKERWALPEKDAERYALLQWNRRALIVRLCEVMFIFVNGSMAIIWLSAAAGALPSHRWLVNAGVVSGITLMSIGVILPLILYLPRLVKVQAQIKEISGTNVLGTREEHWRWGGLVYYAPDDPAILVPKKLGIGQTFNFARPVVWVILAAILILPIAISVGAMLLAAAK